VDGFFGPFLENIFGDQLLKNHIRPRQHLLNFANRPTPNVFSQPLSNPATIVDLKNLPAVACPCGEARRAFADRDEFPGTIHLTHISKTAVPHYHLEHTEVYVILECEPEATIELEGQHHPIQLQTAILIPPGVRHRACGQMTVLILCSPNFDPSDEHFD
jgi:mannose-6-phosphate isomerase-like protein (cupin superfamily)